MIGTFLSLNALRICGMALSYVAIVWLSRTQGAAAVGQYMVVLNGAIVVGTLAAMGLPTLVQRLSARMDETDNHAHRESLLLPLAYALQELRCDCLGVGRVPAHELADLLISAHKPCLFI